VSIGTLYGIGVGPSDPELITVKGLRILQSVPVIAFPAGMQGHPGMALQMITPWIHPKQIQLPLTFPYVLDAGVLQAAWSVAAAQVWTYLQQGQDVAFASEGDVSFYSTFTYLAQGVNALCAEVPIVAIPGVCSPVAAAASLGLPLVIQDQKLAVLPALYQVADLETAIAWADVVVIMKLSSVYGQVWRILQKHQLLQRSFVVERATAPNQVIYRDLSDRPQVSLPYFSLLVVQVKG
jgi:precorrin-2/cobalt-factor-2 C20-methyltransferase